MFAFFAFLFSFATFNVVADEGGAGDAGTADQGGDDVDAGDGSADGADGTEGDIGDLEIDDESDEGESALNADEVKAAREIIAQNQEREMLSSVEKSIQSRTPEFNMSKTVDALRELNKTDPAKAAYYNASEAGLEMYHKDHFANVAKGDEINSGSHSGSGSDFGSTLDKARGGDKKSVISALEQSKA